MDHRTRNRGVGLLFALLLTSLAVFVVHRALFRPPATTSEVTTTGASVDLGSGERVSGSAGPACTSHASCADTDLCIRGRCIPITPATTECRTAMIRFARGTAEISDVAEMTVERAARCIKAGRAPQVSIEESNDAFAGREANAEVTASRRRNVAASLEQRGIPREKIDAVDVRR